ncbi:MAG: hypothetical protein IT503_08810 [Burkholderiaceae bacterium]|nr:MAG: hypothetical protein F9K36_05880 [Burkholderiaceae bacterium]MBE7426349.1 hypothetical protein [Ideonella sp.]MCC7286269.1 hypothetical protein [Burkholderiaceae bacterium]
MKRLSIAIAAAVGVLIVAPISVSAKDKAAKHPMGPLSAEQLGTADRVLLGQSRCEFNQSVNVAAVPGQKGWFNVEYKGKSYLMAPEHTTTGAVRLEDKKAGMMWLQIPNKSMLMNSKIGQRMVDNCVHPSQRT